jgi:hypothetical protein
MLATEERVGASELSALPVDLEVLDTVREPTYAAMAPHKARIGSGPKSMMAQTTATTSETIAMPSSISRFGSACMVSPPFKASYLVTKCLDQNYGVHEAENQIAMVLRPTLNHRITRTRDTMVSAV